MTIDDPARIELFAEIGEYLTGLDGTTWIALDKLTTDEWCALVDRAAGQPDVARAAADRCHQLTGTRPDPTGDPR